MKKTLYDVAKDITLKAGLPYTDPRTGKTARPRRKQLQEALDDAKQTLADALDDTSVLRNDKSEIAQLRDNVVRAKRALMNLETDRDRDFRLILRALGVPPDRVGRLKAFLAWAKRSETIGNEDNVNNELDHIRTLLLEAHKCNT